MAAILHIIKKQLYNLFTANIRTKFEYKQEELNRSASLRGKNLGFRY